MHASAHDSKRLLSSTKNDELNSEVLGKTEDLYAHLNQAFLILLLKAGISVAFGEMIWISMGSQIKTSQIFKLNLTLGSNFIKGLFR